MSILFVLIFAQYDLHASDIHTQSRIVTHEEILQAMLTQKGYDPLATTNAVRFQAGVIIYLVNKAQKLAPKGPPLFIDHADWFWTFLQVNNLKKEEAPGICPAGLST